MAILLKDQDDLTIKADTVGFMLGWVSVALKARKDSSPE